MKSPPYEMLTCSAYLAPAGFEGHLAEELGPPGPWDATEPPGCQPQDRGRLLLRPGPPRQTAWAQNIWRDARFIPVESIGHAARCLTALQRNWALCPHGLPDGLRRRATLIAERLPHVSARPQVFGEPAPTAPLGSWTLWEPNLLLAAPDCASPFPNGEVAFVEDKLNPPGRAYLKLWEAFTLLGVRPAPGELCLDLGASPGGWSWVLAGLGARVLAVDKAPLDPRVSRLPNVDHCQGSAFGLDPETVGRTRWLCSDVICYPERLLALVQRWLAADAADNYVCTVKLQGPADMEVVRAFAAIPGSRLMHLFHNKHELTWVRLAQ